MPKRQLAACSDDDDKIEMMLLVFHSQLINVICQKKKNIVEKTAKVALCACCICYGMVIITNHRLINENDYIYLIFIQINR